LELTSGCKRESGRARGGRFPRVSHDADSATLLPAMKEDSTWGDVSELEELEELSASKSGRQGRLPTNHDWRSWESRGGKFPRPALASQMPPHPQSGTLPSAARRKENASSSLAPPYMTNSSLYK